MVIPGMNNEKTLPDYDVARMTGYGAADFDFNAPGTAMDCNRELYPTGIIFTDGPGRYLVRSSQRHPNGQTGIVTHVVVTKASSLLSTSSTGKALTGAIATGLQYVNGLYRIYDLVENGGENITRLDSREWYTGTIQSLAVL